MHHVVHAAVENVARTGLDGPLCRRIAHQRLELIQTAPKGLCVIVELEEVGTLPAENIRLAGQETADQLPLGQRVQHGAVGLYVRGCQFVQNHHNIDVALFRSLTASVAALQSHKPHAPAKGGIQRLQKALHPNRHIHRRVTSHLFLIFPEYTTPRPNTQEPAQRPVATVPPRASIPRPKMRPLPPLQVNII